MRKTSFSFLFTSFCTLTLGSFADESPEPTLNDLFSVVDSAPVDFSQPLGDDTLVVDNAPPPQQPIPSDNLSPYQKISKVCGKTPHHMRAAVRYTTPRGIGYHPGYTTLEGFFAPQEFLGDKWLPFLDVRGHIFDNGKFAANAGLGIRYLGNSRVWGANVYYDYHNASSHHYNQVAAGLENLGQIWDFRINGYFPVGQKISGFSSAKFNSFRGHNLLIQRFRRFAMKGANAEVGAHVDTFKKAPLYFTAGSYYLTGQGKTTWGGELRAVADLLHRHLRIEGNTSYDHLFKWIGQGQVSLHLLFGGKSKVTKEGHRSCSQAMALHQRAIQRVDRHEIIPIRKKRTTSVAINPATGQPWVFFFVNNTSSSDGTYESPYPTLLAAQNASSPNEAIYVFPGDGSTNGMANGITLKNMQILLGASVTHDIPTTLGITTIPAFASSLPQITNTTGDVVTLADNNSVSGFHIATEFAASDGIAGTLITNLIADRNIFVANIADTNGINLINPLGEVTIANSMFSSFSHNTVTRGGNGIYVELNTDNTLDALNIRECSFNNLSNPGASIGGCGLFAHVNAATITNLNVLNSTFTNIGDNSSGVFANILFAGLVTNLNVSGSSFNNFHNSHGIATNLTASSIINLNLSDSTFNDLSGSSGLFLNLFNSAIITLNVEKTDFSNLNNSAGISTGIDESLFLSFQASNNTFSNLNNSSYGVITSFSNTTFSDFNVSNNLFTNINSNSVGISTSAFLDGIMDDFSVSGNNFSNITTGGFGIMTTVFDVGISIAEIANLQVTSNTFTGDSGTTTTGYAASIDIENGTTCLDFTFNTATPVSSPNPYFLKQAASGVLNRTEGSDNTTDVGTFSTSGTIGSPGSCP